MAQGNRDSSPSGNARSDAESSAYRDRVYLLRKASQIIWLLTGILEAFIGVRILLKLLAANPEAGFAQFVYGMTALFLVPFEALLPTPSAGGAVLEISSIVAMLVYALVAWGIVRAIWIIFEQPPPDNSASSTA